ncbi:MAG: hypothetical protein JXP34_22825 [Planctomycetes bacterium]|nr:hypothetical protein [Planctomycetota bacterium]
MHIPTFARRAALAALFLGGCSAPVKDLETRMESRLGELRGNLEAERKAREAYEKGAKEEIQSLRKRLLALAGVEKEVGAHRDAFEDARKLGARVEEIGTLAERLEKEFGGLQGLPTIRNDLRDAVTAAGVAKRRLAELDEELRGSALARIEGIEARIDGIEKKLALLEGIREGTRLGSEAIAEESIVAALAGTREAQPPLWYLPTEREWRASALTAYANSREVLTKKFVRIRFSVRATAIEVEAFLSLEPTAEWAKSYAGAGRWYVPDVQVIAAIEEAIAPILRKIRDAFPSDDPTLRIFLVEDPLAIWQKGTVRLIKR